jgi:adenylylsulfate kinase
MEENRKRSLTKTIPWRAIFIVASVLTTFAFTGRWEIAATVGIVYNVITTALYYFHERLWTRIRWGLE